MASIIHFFDNTLIIKRFQDTAGTDYQENEVATMTINGHIQNVADLENQEYYAAYDGSHKGWIDAGISVHEGDIIIDKDNKRYVIVNIDQKDYSFAMNTHQELILKRED